MTKTNDGGRLMLRSEKKAGEADADFRSICRKLADRWTIPRFLWVRQSEREKAEGELLTLQGPHDERSLSLADLDAAIDAYHEHLIDVSRRYPSIATCAQVVAFGGSVSLEDQSPDKMATSIRIYGGRIDVGRGTAPSLPDQDTQRDCRGPIICLDVRLSYSQIEALRGVQS